MISNIIRTANKIHAYLDNAPGIHKLGPEIAEFKG